MDDEDFRNQVFASLSWRETDELIEIWQNNDRSEWTDIAFDVIQQILRSRIGTLPPQDPPIYEHDEQETKEDFDNKLNKDEYPDDPQQNTNESLHQPTIDWNGVDEKIIIRQQWMAFIAFIFFNLVGLIFIIYTIISTNLLRMPELAKYSFIGAYLSMVYISLSSIKNRISIARQGGVWNYANGTPAIVFGVIFFILAALYLVFMFRLFF